MRALFSIVSASSILAFSSSAIVFYNLGTLPGATHSLAFDVSDVGSVVVGSVSINSDSLAFRWTPGGGMAGLAPLSGYVDSTAYGVSADGTTIVGFDRTGGGAAQAFRWTQSGGMVGLGYLGSSASTAMDVSRDGSVIVGYAGTSSGMRAFRWTQAGGMASLGTLAGDLQSYAYGISTDSSTIVGESDPTSATAQAMRWTQAGGMVGLGRLPGDTFSQAFAASSDGSVIVGISGTSSTGPGGREAFRWTQSQGMLSLGLLDAYAVSGDGSVVAGDISNGAAIWDAAHGTRELMPMLQGAGIDMSGWILASAQSISSDGQTIVGYGQFGNYLTAWMVVIPEPATCSLLLLAGAVLVCRRRRAFPVS